MTMKPNGTISMPWISTRMPPNRPNLATATAISENLAPATKTSPSSPTEFASLRLYEK